MDSPWHTRLRHTHARIHTHTHAHIEWAFYFNEYRQRPDFTSAHANAVTEQRIQVHHSMWLWMERRKRPTKINYFVALLWWYRCEDVWMVSVPHWVCIRRRNMVEVCVRSFVPSDCSQQKKRHVRECCFENSRIRYRAQPFRNHIVYTFLHLSETHPIHGKRTHTG